MLNGEGHFTMISKRHAVCWKRDHDMWFFEGKLTVLPLLFEETKPDRFLHILPFGSSASFRLYCLAESAVHEQHKSFISWHYKFVVNAVQKKI